MTFFDNNLDSIEKHYNDGQIEKCKSSCEFVLSIQKSNPTALYYSGKIAELCGDIKTAFDYYRELALIFPFNPHFADLAIYLEKRLLEGKERLQQTNLENEIELSKRTIEDFPHRPALRYCENELGKFVVPLHPSNDQISNKIIEGTVFEEEIVNVAKKYIKPGTIAIDVGANLGQMSVIFSRMIGKNGTIYSIEADDYLHAVLTKNKELNGAYNIVTINKAAHDKDNQDVIFPEQDLRLYHTYGAYGIDPKATSGRVVKTMTIDSLNIKSEISFMKVDVQGADLFALRGAVETIKKYQFPIIFEYEEEFQSKFGTTFQDYVDFVTGINYKFAYTVKDINYVIYPK